MNKNKYYINYFLELYSKPEIWDGELKKYNKDSGYFENTDDLFENFIENSIEIDMNIARIIMKDMIHSNYGRLLNDADEKWLNHFESEVKKRKELYFNDNLMYNYLILKSNLAGLSENVSTKLFAYFFQDYKNNQNKKECLLKIINILETIINQKKYWIPVIDDELKAEYSIIDDIMLKRVSVNNFDFSFFENRYLTLCNNGFIKKIANFNMIKSKYIIYDYKLEDLTEFLFIFYKQTIKAFMEDLSEDYPYFKSNPASSNMIYKNMEEILRYSMKFWQNNKNT